MGAPNYEIFADGKFVASEMSLVAACGLAKSEARLRPGVVLKVTRPAGNGDEARYRLLGTKMEAWVR